MNEDFIPFLMSSIIFLPTVGALVLLLFNKEAVEGMRYTTLIFTVLTFILSLLLLASFDPADPGIQPVNKALVASANGGVVDPLHEDRGVTVEWIKSWNIYYRLGYDGISLPLVLLTGLISALATLASWSIKKQVKGYLILFLLLETGMMGVFLALDFFLFYIFWEVMLLPMYFLIGVWGGPRREYAAIKFFLYTLFGGVLMLISMLMFYFGSAGDGAESTFNLLRLAAIGQGRVPGILFSQGLQITAFILLFIGFA
ncbi:MAG: NADH-quinone oxidoreductase subunit M, partial [Planctomycetaceae bacterium]|nr:NADH-quinone oxidoreductase subunit M [Planctomycetaceae bacterium]